tara:strand:- start:108 stop:668 length:561 start_codon:yes stop_codon:yes gene_type:complete
MFKEGEEVLTTSNSGYEGYLVVDKNKVLVRRTLKSWALEYYFYVFLTLFSIKLSYDLLARGEFILLFIVLSSLFLFGFLVFWLFKSRRVKKEFDFDSGCYKEDGEELARIEDISQFFVISHSSSSSNKTSFQFGFYTSKNKFHVLIDHSNYSRIKHDVQMLSEHLNVPYEWLSQHDKYKPNPIRAF